MYSLRYYDELVFSRKNTRKKHTNVIVKPINSLFYSKSLIGLSRWAFSVDTLTYVSNVC